MNLARPWVVIGNPENRRIALFQEALASRDFPPALELSYLDLLTGRRSLDEIPRDAVVRIDSPGENFAVEKQLLEAGAQAAIDDGGPFIGTREIARLSTDPGRILFPRQWFLGFRRALLEWRDSLSGRDDILLVSQPEDIVSMFDKASCQQQCGLAGIPVPTPLGNVGSFDDLADRMNRSNFQRVFVKLRHGSSASGVVAIYRRGDHWEATSSAEMVRHDNELRLYNSLSIRRYTALEDVRVLVDALIPHGVQVERWLPKASLAGRVCDLRVVVIAGEPHHMVVRTSRHPLTNLHLGNRRGNLNEFLSRISDAQQSDFAETCRRAAKLYSKSQMIALDVLFSPGFRGHALLEINAFGDLLPRVLHAGKNTYEAQIDAVTSREDFE